MIWALIHLALLKSEFYLSRSQSLFKWEDEVKVTEWEREPLGTGRAWGKEVG